MYSTPPSPSTLSTPPTPLFNNDNDLTHLISSSHRPLRTPLGSLSLESRSRQRPPPFPQANNNRHPRISTPPPSRPHDFIHNPTHYRDLHTVSDYASIPTTPLTPNSAPPPNTTSILALGDSGGWPPLSSMTESPVQQQQPTMERHPMYGHMRMAAGSGTAGSGSNTNPTLQEAPKKCDATATANATRGHSSKLSTGNSGDSQTESVRDPSSSSTNRSLSAEHDQHQQQSQAGPARTTRRHAAGGTPPPKTKAQAAALDQIPRAFVLQRLHELAPTFLSNPRTSDVRIVVPARGSKGSSLERPAEPRTPESASAGLDAQGIAPTAPSVPARSYKLHRDYLVPQSSLFRVVLTAGLRPGAPELKGCRLLPFTSLHGPRPVYVPLPDPDSFDVLVQWMYYGSVDAIEAALSSGQVSWRGLVANIQYLGMDDRTKRVVGGWWRRWAKAGGRDAKERQIGRSRKTATEDSDDEGREEDEDRDIEAEGDADSAWQAVADVPLTENALRPDPVTEEMSARLGGL